jgi:hypothetical protein
VKQTDAELIERWRLGDSRAMAMLVSRYNGYLVAKYGEDVAQDVWLRIVTYAGLSSTGSLLSLLCRVADGKIAAERAHRAVYEHAVPTLQIFGGPVPGAWSRVKLPPPRAEREVAAWPTCRLCPRPAASRKSGLCKTHRHRKNAGLADAEGPIRPRHRRLLPVRPR